LRDIIISLSAVAPDSARFEARQILCHVMRIPQNSLLLHMNEAFPEDFSPYLVQMIDRRRRGEPLQYILGEWTFMGLPFHVRPGVLIPRQDTETLCEHALVLAKGRGYHTLLDMCCGSGCIGVSVAKLSAMDVTFADISGEALELAKENAELNQIKGSFINSDLFDKIEGGFDMLCCNPPYLSREDMLNLQREVTYEPRLALFGGEDGLDFYRLISNDYKKHLRNGGAMLLEVGISQAQCVIEIFGEGYAVKDINGIDRVVVIC